MRRDLIVRLLTLATVVVLLPACGLAQRLDGRDDRGAATVSASPLAAVEAAVVRIEAQGSFVDPTAGEVLNAAGAGSGFIIDPSGIAVTNNHVVTGAALLDVYVADESEPRNARVLGVSECSDLAVIDIEGDGLPFLEWAAGEPATGTEVYAAGYPLAGPDITLTKGIVSRRSVPTESAWASVDQVLLHDATINPGSSGGPLVDTAGRVVGVNYAADPQAAQFFAIARGEALPLIDRLRVEEDVTSVGINGQAFLLDDGTSGVWVWSVDTGSPADVTGVRGGDIVTRLEDLVVGDDGTMSDYCDVLRSNSTTAVLDIEVLRTTTGETLRGQLNGAELVVTTAATPAATPPPPPPTPVEEVGVADALSGTWQGVYRCGQGLTGLTLTVFVEDGDSVLATFDFYRAAEGPEVPSGRFAMRGSYTDSQLILDGDYWVDRPNGYLMVGLAADLPAPPFTALTGEVVGEARCENFEIARISDETSRPPT